MQKPQVQTAQNEVLKRAAYQAPVVRDLGPWKTMTLIYSVGINPSNALNPAGGKGNVF